MSHQNIKNNGIINFLVMDRHRLARHAVLLIWLFFVFINEDFLNKYSGTFKWFIFITVYITFVVMVYVNLYILVPIFLFKGKYWLYFISLLIIGISGLYFLLNFIGGVFHMRYGQIATRSFEINQYFSSVHIIILFILTTTTIKLLQRWIRDSNRISELKSLTADLELNELKNQITPHFLFNMLNNIKALIRIEPQKATNVIIKLSDLLRYQLYESSEKKVMLASEIKFIDNFLSLEKIRRDNFNFEIYANREILEVRNVEIPPNLFIPFVENAVKHSIDIDGKDSNIFIRFSIDETEIVFSCSNSTPLEKEEQTNQYGGLGLRNITRRLQLLYHEDEYRLETASLSGLYSVNLKIPI